MLTTLVFLTIITFLIAVFIETIIGLRIISKYFTTKKQEYLSLGLVFIFLGLSFVFLNLPSLIFVFFNISLTDRNVLLSMLVQNIFMTTALLFWIFTFCRFVFSKKIKKYMVISCIIFIPFIIFNILLILVVLTGGTQFIEIRPYITNIYNIFGLISLLLTGSIFFRELNRTESGIVRWKGRFLFIGIIILILCLFLSFVGTFYRATANLTYIFEDVISSFIYTMIFILYTISAVLFYYGFFLPKHLEKWIEKNFH